jgi:predicted Zn-dependent protease
MVTQKEASVQRKSGVVAYYCPDCKRRLLNLGHEQGFVSSHENLEKHDRESVHELPKELRMVNFERTPIETRHDELMDILKYAPDNANARFDLALLYYSQKQLPQALEQFLEVLKRAPDHAPTLHKLLNIYTAENELEKAIAIATNLISHEPENQEVLFHFALLLMNANQLSKARETLQQLVTLNPEHAEGVALIAELENLPIEDLEKETK